jgi:hypothetical protein
MLAVPDVENVGLSYPEQLPFQEVAAVESAVESTGLPWLTPVRLIVLVLLADVTPDNGGEQASPNVGRGAISRLEGGAIAMRMTLDLHRFWR